jgi:hypothetical protein
METAEFKHEHAGPQCKSHKGEICPEEHCKRDHHVSRHVEVRCKPAAGQKDRYECVHGETE